MRRGRRVSAFSTAGAAVALLMSVSMVTASLFPYGTIVFVSDRDWLAGTPGSDIYTMNPDGTMVTRLTSNALTERDPVLSPDGSKIAYEVTGHIREGLSLSPRPSVLNATPAFSRSGTEPNASDQP